jgi:signal peptidase I
MGSRGGYGDGRDVEAEAPPRKGILRDYTETILVCVIFVIFSRAFVFQQSKIPSGSMMDSLLIGDYIMVNRFVYAPTSFDWEEKILPIRSIRRGDIVVFKYPRDPGVDYIKRVIGLPGDTVKFQDGYLFVNGVAVDEPYVKDEYRILDTPKNKNFGPVTVGPGEYLVCGDHRDSSADSREWGPVPEGLLKGRALLIWYSYEEKANSHMDNTVERVKSWGDKIVHFFSKTRFRRIFSLIR